MPPSVTDSALAPPRSGTASKPAEPFGSGPLSRLRSRLAPRGDQRSHGVLVDAHGPMARYLMCVDVKGQCERRASWLRRRCLSARRLPLASLACPVCGSGPASPRPRMAETWPCTPGPMAWPRLSRREGFVPHGDTKSSQGPARCSVTTPDKAARRGPPCHRAERSERSEASEAERQ